MSESNAGLTADPLFIGATRPPMRWGVTYSALLFNMVFTMEAFLLTKNLLTLLRACQFTEFACCYARAMRDFSISYCCGPKRDCPRRSPICDCGRPAATRR